MDAPRTGALLLQLGTPAAPTPTAVRPYLREFLGDPRVIDIPWLPRKLLLEGAILPFRPSASAEAYAAIWRPEGSPLLLESRALAGGVAKELGAGWAVELGMRYGRPSIREAVERLCAADLRRIVVLPLFPQYAASSSGSALERALRAAGAQWNVPAVTTVGEFYDDPGVLEAQAEPARRVLAEFEADAVLFSYHGLPERQIRKSDPSGAHCLERADCCDAIGAANRRCYRAQCFATTRALAERLGLPPERCRTSFQSRLGRQPWIKPYTDELLPELAREGVRRLAVLCPSFVADCLETLEEIGLRAREQWLSLGGEELRLVPCPNAEPAFVRAVAELLRRHLSAGESESVRSEVPAAGG